jgi:hypothetical protein
VGEINFPDVEKAYIVAKEVFSGNITQGDGINKLLKSGWVKGSAKDYLEDYCKLVRGEPRNYERNYHDILYYISQIYIDDKNNRPTYKNALSTLKSNVDFLKRNKRSFKKFEQLYKQLHGELNESNEKEKFIYKVCEYYKKTKDYLPHRKKRSKSKIKKQNKQPLNGNSRDSKSSGLKNSEITNYLNGQVTSELVKYLNMVLPKIADKWWDKTVLKKLSDIQIKNVKNKKITKLEGLDLAALLRIFDQNWYEISPRFNFTKQERNILNEMQSVRNRWAHVPDEGYKADDIYRDLDTIQRFLKLINADQRLIDELQKIKLDFLPNKNN